MPNYVNIDGVNIEIPRHVHKPGEFKVVNTEAELRAAFAAGWVLRLTEPVDASDKAPAPPPTFAEHLAGMPAKDAVMAIEGSSDLVALTALVGVEDRATVERAIEKRIAELKATQAAGQASGQPAK